MNNKGINSKIIVLGLICISVLTLTSCEAVFDALVERAVNEGIDYVFKKDESKQDEKPNEDNQSQFSPRMNSFYFLADTAFQKIENANNEIRKLKNIGYNQAGTFWLRDYPNLSNKPYYQVYVAKFSSRRNCIELLEIYIQRNQDAYCAFASKNKNASPDYFGSYSLRRRRNR